MMTRCCCKRVGSAPGSKSSHFIGFWGDGGGRFLLDDGDGLLYNELYRETAALAMARGGASRRVAQAFLTLSTTTSHSRYSRPHAKRGPSPWAWKLPHRPQPRRRPRHASRRGRRDRDASFLDRDLHNGRDAWPVFEACGVGFQCGRERRRPGSATGLYRPAKSSWRCSGWILGPLLEIGRHVGLDAVADYGLHHSVYIHTSIYQRLL